MPQFQKEKFEQEATVAAMESIDQMMIEWKLEERYAQYPEIIAAYRHIATVAWMNGAAWGFEAGVGDSYRRYYG